MSSILDFVEAHQILSILCLILLLAYSHHLFFITAKPNEPPLVKGFIPFLGVALEGLINLEALIHANKRRHGDIFTLYVLGMHITIVTDPIDGIPSIFRKPSKQLSMKSGIRTVFIKCLGFSPKRADEDDLNREHWQMLPTYLLSTNPLNELTGRFLDFLLRDLRRCADEDKTFKIGKVVDFSDWIGRTLFIASSLAVYGEGVLDGADENMIRDFKTWENGFPLILMLPEWMTVSIGRARDRLRKFFGRNFAKGLKNTSTFVDKRIEVFILSVRSNQGQIQLKYGYSLESVGADLLGLTFGLAVLPPLPEISKLNNIRQIPCQQRSGF
jgi:hypothetical protein